MEAKLNEIPSQISLLKPMNDDISEIKRTVEGFNERVLKLENKLEEVMNVNRQLKEKVDYLESKFDYQENQGRRNNLVFKGLPEKPSETWDECKQVVMSFIKDQLGVDIAAAEIERAHRLNGNFTPRNVIVKFGSYCKREEIWRAKWNLPKESQVFVWEDFSKKVQQERKFLLEEAKERKVKGVLTFDTMKIGNERFKYCWKEKKVIQMSGNSRPKRKRDGGGSKESPRREEKVGKQDEGSSRKFGASNINAFRARSSSLTGGTLSTWVQRAEVVDNNEA